MDRSILTNKITAALALGVAGLYLATTNERSRGRRDSEPVLKKYALELLPGWEFHLISYGPAQERKRMLVLDSLNKNEPTNVRGTVVMLHGFPDNALYFHKVAANLGS